MSDRRSFEAATVLVVDDQPEILRTLSRFLGAKGYCVEIATTVSEAIPLLHAGVRAVVLDVRLPHDSGLELLEFIRRDDRLCELPVLILTGVVLTREEEAMIARDRAYVFYKPKSYETAWNASAKDNLTTGGALENLGYSGATLAGSSRRGSGPRVAHHASILPAMISSSPVNERRRNPANTHTFAASTSSQRSASHSDMPSARSHPFGRSRC